MSKALKRSMLLLRILLAMLVALVVVKLHPIFAFDPNTNCDSDDLSILEECITGFSEAYQQSVDATKPLEGELAKLNSQIKSAQNGISAAKNKSIELAASIENREEDLAIQYHILSRRIAEQYKRSRIFSPFMTFLATQDAAKFTKDMAYRSSVKAQDNRLIESISQDIEQLEADTVKLEQDQIRLAALENKLDDQAEFFRVEIKGAKDYQSQLSGKIAALSARQQEIINARSGTFTVSLSSAFSSGGLSSRADFISSAPAGYFAVFSFGAYTHRNGMSQYGALGRVKQGKNAEEILKYYYQGVSIEKVDTNTSITVNGTNTYGQTFNNESYQFEEYLKHIYEMPGSWPKEALKAQAIAARSYAYGKSAICPGQGCQEFKREENTDSWKEAVKETEGLIMKGGSGGYQYSSTTGGWLNGTGWDTTDGQGGANFLEKTYETLGGSPWTYSAWYVDIFGEYGSRGGACGRSNPWLSPEEMGDIVNAHLVLKNGSSEEASRISPISTSCWGGNPYSLEELRKIASKYGGINSADSVTVSQGNGSTSTVTINGINISAGDFKKAFSLRAPGFIRIPQSGFAFFNIEHK